jgi:hypothetical protein
MAQLLWSALDFQVPFLQQYNPIRSPDDFGTVANHNCDFALPMVQQFI